jgi:hypothetical protein
MNLSFKMLLACETAFVYFGTFSNRFQIIFLIISANFLNAFYAAISAPANV